MLPYGHMPQTHTLPQAACFKTCSFVAVACIFTTGCQRCHQQDTWHAAAVLCMLPCGCQCSPQSLQVEILYGYVCFSINDARVYTGIWEKGITTTPTMWNQWWAASGRAWGWWRSAPREWLLPGILLTLSPLPLCPHQVKKFYLYTWNITV